ncbi:MAG TPA: oligopeptide/dipeptide ABC transporter ATP-binding protein [Solirubrobacteraceae bacterium]|jgi:peptide/nickel transport system ATP-binding protein|nr:oligopeptide/dipeptide ABC transporter ATP-binding protein [Solirubrobacteraceae bacterium]
MTALLEVSDLVVEFPQRGWRRAPFRAVDGVSFDVREAETVGLVGESGSGKSTIGRAILGLTPVAAGAIRYAGTDIANATARARRRLASELQVIFQDPYSSLDPLRTVGESVGEPLAAHTRLGTAEIRERVGRILEQVGLPDDAQRRYPRAFSGGQRQRIAIARALTVQPRLLICDEPISALDLSTQAQVLNLLGDLQAQLGVAYLFIAHNLDVVRHLSSRVVVLYRGRIMESGPAPEISASPLHPYSRALWAASPVADPERQARRRRDRAAAVRSSTTAAGVAPLDGCPFTPRCPHAHDVCLRRRPADTPVGERVIACHLFDAGSGHPDAGRGTRLVPPLTPTPERTVT